MIPTTREKNTAIILGATGNLSFALGVVLKGLKKYNPTLVNESDIIIYYQQMSEEARAALNKVLPCTFIAYKFPDVSNMRSHVLKDYGEMTFVRYECFRYLKQYQYVLWLDADILIRGDISDIRNKIPHGIGFRREYDDERLRRSFTTDIDGFDMKAPHYNAGIMCISQAIQADKDQLSDWCYQKTMEISQYLLFPDQGVLQLMCQQFNITIDALPETYNCEAQRHYFATRKALILHAIGHRKFWKYYYFNRWYQFYKELVQETGIKCGNNFPLLQKWGLLKYPLFQVAPDPAKYPVKFLTYLLRWILKCES